MTSVPASLYKYVAFQRLNSIIGSGLIRYSQTSALNDPFEFTVNRPELFSTKFLQRKTSPDKIRQVLDEKLKKHGLSMDSHIVQKFAGKFFVEFPEMVRQLANSMNEELSEVFSGLLSEHIRILSLAETPQNLLMWAHYADSHGGAVIEIDGHGESVNNRRSDKDEFRYPRQVIYVERMPTRAIDETDSEVLFLTKGLPWAYEKEWRVLQAAEYAKAVVGDAPNEICLYELSIADVKSVTFGARVSEAQIKAEVDRISALNGSNHIKFLRAVASTSNYEVSLRAL